MGIGQGALAFEDSPLPLLFLLSAVRSLWTVGVIPVPASGVAYTLKKSAPAPPLSLLDDVPASKAGVLIGNR